MTNKELALKLAELAHSHAEKAGHAANDVDVKARMSTAGHGVTENLGGLAVAAQAHASAALAYKEASLAFTTVGAGVEMPAPVGGMLSSTFKVWRSKDQVTTVQDALGRVVLTLGQGVGYLWFLDLEPEANWAHDCLYCIGECCRLWDMPPLSSIEMIEFSAQK
ncbi:MAG: hypothetical protein A2Y38_15725 [Spirochaetes bacterium GWB1_59_5]|nr:MAG: hypothetical protein A2Y38_15725 [Spirochaetes bacterium GWB1_59_5]